MYADLHLIAIDIGLNETSRKDHKKPLITQGSSRRKLHVIEPVRGVGYGGKGVLIFSNLK